ncbi:MAG: BCAM0308 family protein [Actinomycetota bacterium]|jgi:NMD protein affecting ribosome stability and mRNA decay|nr:BCAM0308 family protein [Actinomycetota bacterium]
MSEKICTKCMAVFDGQKWFYDEGKHSRLTRMRRAEETLCPGHERIEKRRIDGVVSLKGVFLKDHFDEAMNLIENIADKQVHRNVAARVYNVHQNGEGITVETTETSLAERIGKEFEKAFSGDLTIQWLRDSEFVRVSWQRD